MVEEDASVRQGLQKVLTADGYDVAVAEDCRQAREAFARSRADAVIASCRLSDGSVLDLLAHVRTAAPGTAFLVLADSDSLETAVKALAEGAEQFLVKPVDRPALLFVLQRALENQRARRRRLRDEALRTREPLDPFRGESAAIRALAEQARKVLGADRPVLIQGETGSGKGVLAAWLHANGPRSEECFLDLNCAGLSRDLLETELFGHEKGAFTGAVSSKTGLLEVADRGTFFLDEIGDMDIQVQPKMLKVLEEKRFRRLGDVRDRQVDVWLIAATHQDLAACVEQKRFRGDLYFRISTMLLRIPPLRERIEDIPILAGEFLHTIAVELARGPFDLSPGAVRRLQAHSWPGNIRELRNVLERAALSSSDGSLEAGDFGFDFEGKTSGIDELCNLTLREAERLLIERALREERGNVERAAARLGISRSSLYQRIQKHGIAVSRI
ncbi:MAG TPA: sigma-54 dependent transcriptional regulator [Thermoanaerobaculia bacterium]|nr:sigma-54 dependent transcriptional regulator [Thermoanaerobaculia bacterium]